MTAAETFANQPQTTVLSGGTTAPSPGTSESWTVSSSSSFPAASTGVTQFHVADTATGKTGEIIAVTNVSGTTWTVTRGAESTATVAHSSGFAVVQVVSAGALGGMLQAQNNLSDVASVTTARSNLGLLTNFAPSGLTGATLSSRYAGGTASGAPVSGTFAVGDYVVDQTGKIWLCTTAGSPGTWTQTGAALDGTAGDIQPVGVQAAGSKGQGADAKHVHPYQPWQFYVKSYGAKGDGQVVADGAMSSSSNQTHLACATSTPFANAAAGMPVHVGGAGGGTYTPLCTTISTVTDSGHVVLSASATSTVSSAVVYFGTDDTAAIQSAVNAATTYAQAHGGYAEVLFDPVMYIIGGAAVIGGSTKGNAQVTLPLIATTAEKVTLVFRGTREQTGLCHWQQTLPQASGAVLACARNDGTNDVTNGPAFTVGGPVATYGGGTSVFTNLLPVVDGVGIMVPYNGTYGGWGFYGCAEATVPNAGVFAAAVPPTGSSVPSMSNDGNISNQFPVGLQMPDVNNNDNCYIGQYSCEGVAIGLQMSEHTWFTSAQLIYCVVGIQCGSWSGSSMAHTCGGSHASVELCDSAIARLGATAHVHISRIDTESVSNSVFDPSDFLQGTIGFGYNGSGGYGTISVNGGTALKVLDLMQPTGPVSSPHAAPATTVAWPNLYYRDAWVTVSLSGGNTFTSLNIDSTAQPNAAGACTYQFLLPSGHSYTPAYSAGTLTHTVTLL